MASRPSTVLLLLGVFVGSAVVWGEELPAPSEAEVLACRVAMQDPAVATSLLPSKIRFSCPPNVIRHLVRLDTTGAVAAAFDASANKRCAMDFVGCSPAVLALVLDSLEPLLPTLPASDPPLTPDVTPSPAEVIDRSIQANECSVAATRLQDKLAALERADARLANLKSLKLDVWFAVRRLFLDYADWSVAALREYYFFIITVVLLPTAIAFTLQAVFSGSLPSLKRRIEKEFNDFPEGRESLVTLLEESASAVAAERMPRRLLKVVDAIAFVATCSVAWAFVNSLLNDALFGTLGWLTYGVTAGNSFYVHLGLTVVCTAPFLLLRQFSVGVYRSDSSCEAQMENAVAAAMQVMQRAASPPRSKKSPSPQKPKKLLKSRP